MRAPDFLLARAVQKTDPRYFQILALLSLTVIQITQSDFSPDLFVFPVILGAILVSHYLSEMYVKGKLVSPFLSDYRSVFISAFSLFLLLRANEIWVYALAAFICVFGKVVFRTPEGHIFNPANLAIVLLLLGLPQYVWISPGQWGHSGWLAGLMICLAALVLSGARQLDTAFLFFASFGGMVLARALWLGDELAIPFHSLQNGALLIFTFFMITDPKTTPGTFRGRLVFAIGVAALSTAMIYIFQIREALFYSLAIVCAGYGAYQLFSMRRGDHHHETSFA